MHIPEAVAVEGKMRGTPLSGAGSREIARWGQCDTQRPQPMQASQSKTGFPSPASAAPKGQTTEQVPQPMQVSLSIAGLYPEWASLGDPARNDFIPRQQQRQQLQMA